MFVFLLNRVGVVLWDLLEPVDPMVKWLVTTQFLWTSFASKIFFQLIRVKQMVQYGFSPQGDQGPDGTRGTDGEKGLSVRLLQISHLFIFAVSAFEF